MDTQELDSHAFPKLGRAHLAALERCPLTTPRWHKDGETLYRAGDVACKFYVVKSGEGRNRESLGRIAENDQFARTVRNQGRRCAVDRQPVVGRRPGVFAAADVRLGSIKRVASAVGEGAMAIQFVHEYMKEI